MLWGPNRAERLPCFGQTAPDIPGKFSLPLIVFRDCKDGLLAAEGEGGLRDWLPKKVIRYSSLG